MPQVIYHRLIDRDIRCALEYYESEGGSPLADRFFSEVEATLEEIEVRPTSHHFSDGGLRKATLDSFPYHILYEVDSEAIWIAVLRHDRRHPNFGLRRKRGG
ncbi:MAG: type II toxin-antitoxin system RelE/ParE family toxin [Verrucomicrobiales bacterium]